MLVHQRDTEARRSPCLLFSLGCHPERRAQTGSPASTGFVLAGALERGVEVTPLVASNSDKRPGPDGRTVISARMGVLRLRVCLTRKRSRGRRTLRSGRHLHSRTRDYPLSTDHFSHDSFYFHHHIVNALVRSIDMHRVPGGDQGRRRTRAVALIASGNLG